jgi:3-deoxy-manno-octulosonate cytidylyltransferase (CMP-KDO synthetase)
MHVIAVIPARYQSTRLPGKPLVDIAGTTMIRRTYLRTVAAMPAENVFVATDDERIADHCRETGMNFVMTSTECLTGTDRVAEVATTIGADLYVNVQGDEPLCNPADITAILAAAERFPGRVLNGYCEIDDEADFRSSAIPKTVFRPDGRLLYMSRGPLPTNKALGFDRAWRQVCIYAFPPEALAAFAAQTSKTPLEAIEDIEILRFLELGFDVQMVPMSSESIAVDHPHDVDRVIAALQSTHG